MSISHRHPLAIALWSTAVSAALSFATVRADEPAVAPSKDSSAAKTPAPTADAHQWAKDLDSDIFVTRQEAAKKLFEAGRDAIAPLLEASSGKSLEVTTASVDILRRLSQSTDHATRDAAKAALEKLAKGPNSTAADLAKEALVPPASPNPQPGVPQFGGNIQLGGGIQGGIRIIGPRAVRKIQIMPGGNIRIIPGGAIQVFQIQAKANNGNRTVDVDDNGKKVHIQEDKNGIEVKVTEKVNGQDKIDTFKAKNAAELKQKYPAAHKLYEKYGQNGVGNIQIQAQVGGLAPIIGPAVPAIPLPLGPVPIPAAPKTGDADAKTRIDEARKLIAEATENLKKTAAERSANGAPPVSELRQKAIEKLDQATKKLDDARRKLDRYSG